MVSLHKSQNRKKYLQFKVDTMGEFHSEKYHINNINFSKNATNHLPLTNTRGMQINSNSRIKVKDIDEEIQRHK